MNEEKFSKSNRKILAILALVFGLYTITIGSVLIQINLDSLINTVIPLSLIDPDLATGPMYSSIWVNAIRGIGVVASITLVIIVYPFWKGESWAWPIAISCISLPTIYSVLINLPYMVQVGFPPPALPNLLFGLITYWVFLLLKKGDIREKIPRITVLTLLGFVAGHINVLIMHGIKGLVDTGFGIEILDPMNSIYGFEVPLNFLAIIMCIVAIPLLADRKPAGWWLALIAGTTVAVANLPTHLIRMVTFDFLVAGILGLLLVIWLLIPSFRKNLIGNRTD